MQNREIEFLLTLKDQLTAKWNAVTDKVKAGGKGMVESFKANWLAISAGALGAFETIKTGFEYMQEWAKGEAMANAFRATMSKMGKDAEAEFDRIRTAAQGMIDDDTIYKISNRWLAMGMNIADLPKVFELARIKARESGSDMMEAAENLSSAFALGKEKGLKALNVAVDTDTAYKAYAVTLGKTVQELTAVEKKQAVLNAALEAGRKSAEGMDMSTKTLNEQISSYKRNLAELQDFIGMLFARIVTYLSGVAYAGGAYLSRLFAIVLAPISAASGLLAKLGIDASGVTDLMNKSNQRASELATMAATSFSKAASGADEFAEFMTAASGAIVSAAETTSTAVESMANDASKVMDLNSKKNEKNVAESLGKQAKSFKQYFDSLKVESVQEYELVRGLTEDMQNEITDRMNTIHSVMSGMLSTLQDTFTSLFNGDVVEGVKGFLKGIVLILIDTVQAFVLAAAAAAWAKGVITFGFSTFADLPMVAAATVGLQLLRAMVSEKFHQGGVVPTSGGYVNAPASQERLVLVRGGETIRTEEQEANLQRSRSGGGVTIVVNANGPISSAQAFKEIIERGMRETGITDAAQYFRNNRSNLVLQA